MKDITEEDTFLYVRGHDLFDHILNSVINPIITNLRNQHYTSLRTSEADEKSRAAALCEYQKKVKPVKPLLTKNYLYKHKNHIYDKIKADVVQIWE